MVALGPALGTPADLCPPSTAQLQSTTWLATQPLSQLSWLSPTRAEPPYGPLPSSAKPSDPWTEPTGASMALRLRTLECHPAGPSPAPPHPQTDSRHTGCKRSIHLWQSAVWPWGPWKEEPTEDMGEGMQEERPGQWHANTWTDFAFSSRAGGGEGALGEAVFGAPDGGRNKVRLRVPRCQGCWWGATSRRGELLAHLLKQIGTLGTAHCDVIGIRGIRSSHLLAPSKPFPEPQAHSASFSGQAPSPTPQPPQPLARATTHSSCVSGLSLLGTERRELTVKLEEGGLG